MPDKNGYPTEEELKKIETWKYENPTGLIDFIKDLWWMSDWGFKLKGKRVLYLELHTGGWSGNEDIVAALTKSFFWALYWRKHTVGGHYYFRIDLDRWKKAEKQKREREERLKEQADKERKCK